MKKRIAAIFFVFICFFNFSFSISYAAAPGISAGAAILMDAETGEVLYSRNADKVLYPASITKIMTALLASEKGNLDDVLTMSFDAVFSIERGSSHIALDVDEEITLEQALNGLLLMSANDAGNGIAEYIGGSIEGFAEMMTNKAKELGAMNTNFVNPHGLHDENHYTTAYDMALIAREALKYDAFRNIINTTSYEIPPTNKQEETRYLYNQHKMLENPAHRSTYFYEGVIGGKTGYTDQAQHTLVTYAEQDGTTLICVIINADTQPIMYTDTVNLFNYGFNEVSKLQLNKANQVVDTLPIYNDIDGVGKGMNKLGYVDLIALEEFIYYGATEMSEEDVIKKLSFGDPLLSPVYKDESIGEMQYVYQGTVIGSVPLVAGQTYEKVDTSLISTLQQDVSVTPDNGFIDIIYLGVIIIALFLALILLWRIIKYVRRG